MDPRDEYVSDWPTEDAEPKAPRTPGRGDGYVKGEQALVGDGVVGGAELESGPENANPEGSSQLSNEEYDDGAQR